MNTTRQHSLKHFCFHQAKCTPLGRQESYTKALSKVESENQRLPKELSGIQASFDASSWVPKKTHESIVQRMQNKMTEIKNTESR